jgi:TonB family protein
MILASVESRPWSRRRWWGLVVLIFGGQLALIFWLGETSPIQPRPTGAGLTLRLAGSASADSLALRDPTLFVLPHPQALSAPAWLKAPQPEARAIKWPEPVNRTAPAIDQLGAALNRLVGTNDLIPLLPLARPEPRLVLPEFASQPVWTEQSAVRLEGALAQRRLITPLVLRSWSSRDILTNTVVQLIVDAEGVPRSATLLAGSGSQEADQHALNQAKTVRFEPLSRNPGSLTPAPTAPLIWGRMVFLWHTLPLPPTNAPAVSP